MKPPHTVLCSLTVHTELVALSGSAKIASRMKPPATVLCWLTVHTELVALSGSAKIASRMKPPATELCWLTVHTELVALSGSANITNRMKPQATAMSSDSQPMRAGYSKYCVLQILFLMFEEEYALLSPAAFLAIANRRKKKYPRRFRVGPTLQSARKQKGAKLIECLMSDDIYLLELEHTS